MMKRTKLQLYIFSYKLSLINVTCIALTSIVLSSCFWGDEEQQTVSLTKDYSLFWWSTKKNMSIHKNNDPNIVGGETVVNETVTELNFNTDFIIAKQHPNKQGEIQSRLFDHIDTLTKDFLLINPADSVYLTDDSIYQKNGKYYHISNGWNPPDSLYPYMRITNYYIIDIRSSNYQSYHFSTLDSFEVKRRELGLDPKLSFKDAASFFETKK